MIAILLLPVLLPHFLVNETISVSSSTAKIYVEPPEVNISASQSFEIAIAVANVTNFGQFTLHVSFNNTLLAVLDARNGAENASNLDFKPFNPANWNATGDIQIDGTFHNPVDDVTLAIITFRCQNEGVCYITVTNATKLVHPGLDPITYVTGPACRCSQSVVINESIYVDKNYTMPCNLFLGVSQNLFIINGSDIVLDLNGFTIASQQFKTGTGIQASDVNNICIKNGTISTFQTGIDIRKCNGVKIINVRLQRSYNIGIEMADDSSNLTIADSTINDTQSGEGIWLKECCPESGSWANITNNVISHNVYGICLESSNNCTINNNTIMFNDAGLYLKTAVRNTLVFNNNFIQNTNQLGQKVNVKAVNSKSVWNSTYPYGGNYWDDYADQKINDSVCGKNGTALGCDGIGDTPYHIPGDTQDNYPLLYPFNASRLRIFDTQLKVSRSGLTEIKNLLVAIYGDFADVGNLKFRNTTEGGLVTFDISGATSCNVIVSRDLLDGPFRISVDNATTASTLYWDSTHMFAEFDQSAQSHEVEIATKRAGDINGDGKVNIIDITMIGKLFMSTIEPYP